MNGEILLQHTGFLLQVAAIRANQQIANLLEEFHINPSEYFMLLLLDADGEDLSQKRIAETLFLNVNTVTRLLDEMERKKLARRHSNPDNRKENLPAITPHGSRIAKAAARAVDAGRGAAYRDITEKELNELHRILYKLFEAKGPRP